MEWDLVCFCKPINSFYIGSNVMFFVPNNVLVTNPATPFSCLMTVDFRTSVLLMDEQILTLGLWAICNLLQMHISLLQLIVWRWGPIGVKNRNKTIPGLF